MRAPAWRSAILLLGVVVLFLVSPSLALRFDILAQAGHSAKNERCIRNFVGRDTLVVVTATVSGQKGDGMVVNMHVGVPGRGEKRERRKSR